MNRRTFLLAMLLPLAIILLLIGANYYTLYFGKEVMLKTAPVDPWDFFRGDYMTLRYEISTIDLSHTPHDKDFNYGENVYAVLSKGDKFWTITKLEHDKPVIRNTEVCMKGKITYLYQNSMTVVWGIESYFVPEGKGRTIESQRMNVTVMAAVDTTCRAMIKKVYVNDEPLKFGN